MNDYKEIYMEDYIKIRDLEIEIVKLKEENRKLKAKLENMKTINHNCRGAGRPSSFTTEQAEEMKRLKLEGESIRTIAKRFKCSPSTVHKLIKKQESDCNFILLHKED